jgi:hypothetical protein
MTEFTSAEVSVTMPVENPLLDVVSATAEAAWSYDKLLSSYSGFCIRAHDASDKSGSSQDIGFDANGDLDTSALESFAGSGDAWMEPFDQTDGSVITTATPPKIVASGSTLLDDNGKPAPQFSGDQRFQMGTTPTGGYTVCIEGDGVAENSTRRLTTNGTSYQLLELNGDFEFKNTNNDFVSFEDDPTIHQEVIFTITDPTGTFRVYSQGVKKIDKAINTNGSWEALSVGNTPNGGNAWSQVTYCIVFQSELAYSDLRAVALNRGMI